jgi:septal ring factor EnvC (AmiA/AmiB activator)
MRKTSLQTILCLGASLALSGFAVSAADSPDDPGASDPVALEMQLQALETEINKFRKMLDATSGERSKLEQTLQSNEESINELLKKIDDIQRQLTQGESKIGVLQREQAGLETAQHKQQDYLVRQIRAAYEIGKQPYMKVLLNLEHPDQVDRILTYYDYFNRARTEQIQRYRDTIQQLDTVKQLLETENKDLADNRARVVQREQSLQIVRLDKQVTLRRLNHEIASTGGEIKKLTQSREELEALLANINLNIEALPSAVDTASFASRRGKMTLPIAGKIVNRYGSQRSSAKLKWNGVFITAEQGEPVHAIHYGRVVFSDWLRGFGLMIIVSHGEGYMSLYGHNQVLYKETGDWVSAGDNIAAVGDSGGQSQMGLYFEIRQSGKPTNPQQWCQQQRQRAA